MTLSICRKRCKQDSLWNHSKTKFRIPRCAPSSPACCTPMQRSASTLRRLSKDCGRCNEDWRMRGTKTKTTTTPRTIESSTDAPSSHAHTTINRPTNHSPPRELRVAHEPALLRQHLVLVFAIGLQIVRRLGRTRHLLEGELADAHAGIERDGE